MTSFIRSVEKINKLIEGIPPNMKPLAAAAALGSLVGYYEFRLKQHGQEVQGMKSLLIEVLATQKETSRRLDGIEAFQRTTSQRVDKLEINFDLKFVPMFKKLEKLGKKLVPPPLPSPISSSSASGVPPLCVDPVHAKFFHGMCEVQGLAAMHDFFKSFALCEGKKQDTTVEESKREDLSDDSESEVE